MENSQYRKSEIIVLLNNNYGPGLILSAFHVCCDVCVFFFFNGIYFAREGDRLFPSSSGQNNQFGESKLEDISITLKCEKICDSTQVEFTT